MYSQIGRWGTLGNERERDVCRGRDGMDRYTDRPRDRDRDVER